jgi:hypothetical protein
MSLQGNHYGLIIGFPFSDGGTGIHNGGGKFMPEGNVREDGFVSFMIEPGVQIGTANSTMGDPK